MYLKEVEGMRFVDKTYLTMKRAAERVGFKVGPYDFLHPLDATPHEVFDFFVEHAYAITHRHSLRPCFDCEYGKPSAKVGVWITVLAQRYAKELGYKPLIYGSGWWLQECKFPRAPGPLWLAAYGRDDGREYPVGRLPSPWRSLAAHQYTDKAHVVGISGACDLSKVFRGTDVDVPVAHR